MNLPKKNEFSTKLFKKSLEGFFPIFSQDQENEKFFFWEVKWIFLIIFVCSKIDNFEPSFTLQKITGCKEFIQKPRK